MGNVKMANVTINNSTMLLRLLFSTAKHMLTTITKRQQLVLVIIVDPEILYVLNC